MLNNVEKDAIMKFMGKLLKFLVKIILVFKLSYPEKKERRKKV